MYDSSYSTRILTPPLPSLPFTSMPMCHAQQLMRLSVEQDKMSKIKKKERVKEDAAESVADHM